MKKVRIACVVLCLLVFLFAAGCGGTGRGEDLYFSLYITHLANTAEGWAPVPIQVYHYTGGETCSLAYTLPDAQDYALAISGSRLYYVPEPGGPVTCVDLKSGGEKTLGELPPGWVFSDLKAEGDRVFALSCTTGGKYILYEVAAQSAKVICEDALVQAEMALGDGGLFYVDYGDEMALMRYDLKTGEKRKIADTVGIGDLEYDGGYIYSSGVDTLRYDVKTGESSFAAPENGYRVRDGWLYYADYADESADRDPAWKALMRRNLKTGKTESCGTAYMPYLGDLTFRHAVDFGKKGFVVYQTFYKEDTKYMYFPYGASQGIELRLENTGGSAPQGTAPQESAVQEAETQAAKVSFFPEPRDLMHQQEGTVIEQTSIVFQRKRAACADEIDRIKSILQSIDSWTIDTAVREELFADGYFGVSDEERLYFFSYDGNAVFYDVLSMDQETGKVSAERHIASIPETDMEYLRSLKDSKDGIKY